MSEREDELNKWKKRITTARTVRSGYLRDWVYYENMFDDNLWGNKDYKSLSRVTQINELESLVMTMLPQIAFNVPVFEIEDNINGDVFSTLVYEFYALRIYNMLKMYFNTRQIIIDTLLLGGGVHKTGISYHVDQSDEESSLIDELPLSCWVSPKNILYDYRFDSWENKQWIAEEIVKTVEDVKDSDMYENTKTLKGNLSSTYGIAESQNGKPDNELIKIVEIHDIRNKKLMTLSMTHNKFLRYEDDYQEEIYDYLEFTPTRPKRFWGKSLAKTIEEHMVRLARINTWMDSDSEAVGRKIYLVDSSIGNNAVKSLESSKSKVIVPIDGLSQMGNDPIRELRVNSNTFNWQTVSNEIERQIRMLTGVTMQERGAHEPGVETLGEAGMLLTKSETRTKEKALLLSMFMQNIMSKMLTLSSDFIRPQRIAEIVGIPQELIWRLKPFNEMTLEVKFGSTAIEARNTYLNKLTLLGKLLPNSINQQVFAIKMMDALGFGIRDQMLMVSNEPSPTPPTQTGGGGSSPAPQPNVGAGDTQAINNPF